MYKQLTLGRKTEAMMFLVDWRVWRVWLQGGACWEEIYMQTAVSQWLVTRLHAFTKQWQGVKDGLTRVTRRKGVLLDKIAVTLGPL